jgi:hypothetical protein
LYAAGKPDIVTETEGSAEFAWQLPHPDCALFHLPPPLPPASKAITADIKIRQRLTPKIFLDFDPNFISCSSPQRWISLPRIFFQTIPPRDYVLLSMFVNYILPSN